MRRMLQDLIFYVQWEWYTRIGYRFDKTEVDIDIEKSWEKLRQRILQEVGDDIGEWRGDHSDCKSDER